MLADEPNLTVVLVTSRPKLASVCLEQFHQQIIGGLKFELITVIEGHNRPFAHRNYKSYLSRCYYKELQGAAGAYAKDIGIAKATGEYVCCWDDDNFYDPHALVTLYSTAIGFDIGIVSVEQCRPVHNIILPPPHKTELGYGDIDTMCLCVRTELAKQHLWGTGDDSPGTDYRWFQRLVDSGATIHRSPVLIGRHFVN